MHMLDNSSGLAIVDLDVASSTGRSKKVLRYLMDDMEARRARRVVLIEKVVT